MYSFLHTSHYHIARGRKIFMVLWILPWILSWRMIVSWKVTCIPSRNVAITYVTLSHLRSKESTRIQKACIPGLFSILRVHLNVHQRVQKNNSSRIHLNVHWCTFECILEKLFLWTLWSVFWSEAWILSWRLYIFMVKLKHLIKFHCV